MEEELTGVETTPEAALPPEQTPPAPLPAEPAEPGTSTTPENVLTEEDVKKAVEAARVQWEQEQDQAARLAKLSEEDREKEQLRLDREKLENEKAEFQRKRLVAETETQLAERGLSKIFAEKLCGANADETKANIDSFEKDWNTALEAAVTERMKGTPPKTGVAAPHKSIDEMTYTEQVEYYKTHPQN